MVRGGQLKRGALLSYAAIFFNAVAGLLYTPWMVDCIGSADYGLYTLAMSIINFFLLDFGLGNAVSRFLSRYYAEGEDEKVNLFLGIVYKAYMAIAFGILVIFAIIYLSIDTIYVNLTSNQLIVFKRLYIIAALYSVVSFSFGSFDGVLVSNERFVALNSINLAQKVVTVLLIVASLLMGMGVYALVFVNAAVGLVAVVAKYCCIRKQTDVHPKLKYFDMTYMKEILNFSAWVMVSQICQRFIFSVMPTILAMFSNVEEVAVFGLAVSLEGYVWTVANALNGMMMPNVSKVVLTGETGELQALMEKIGRIQVYVIGLIVVGFVVAGRMFVNCWMGPRYESLYGCTVLLILPSLFELPQLVAGTAIMVIGEVKKKAVVFLVMAFLNVALSVPLVSLFGAPGACLSVCVAYLVRTFGMSLLYKKTLSIDLLAFAKAVYARWIMAAFVSGALGAVLVEVLPNLGWMSFAAVVFAICVSYGVVCYFAVFNADERSLVRRLLG